MSRKIISTIMVLALLIAGVVVVTNSSEGTDTVQNGTKDSPYLKSVSMPVGGTKVVYISLNLTAFEFVKKDDGYHIDYSLNPGGNGYIDMRLSADNGSLPSWPETDKTLASNDFSVKPIKADDKGTFGFVISLKKSCTGSYVTVCFNITSMSVTQLMYYKINVIEEASTSYSLTFSDVALDSDGIFSSKGELKVGGESVSDLSNYSFYAVGLYPGVAIHNDLTITGRADISTAEWSSGSPMSFKVVISDKSGNSSVVVDTSVKYTISSTISSLTYSITSGDETKLDNNSTETTVSVLSGTALVLNVTNGTEASVVYTDESSKVSTKMLYSTTSAPGQQTLNTSGNGTYQIILSKTGTTEQKIVTVNVIGSMTALNSIRVTCAPL